MAGQTTTARGRGRRRRLLVGVLAALALLAPPLSAAADSTTGSAADGAATGTTHVVHAGAAADDPAKPYAYEDYFPRHLRVHRGDQVRWEFPGAHIDTAFHTVTFARDADEAPWFRDDELPGTFAWDERTFFTTGCGRAGQPVCVLSEDSPLVSSGTPIQHFSDTPAGLQIQPFVAVIDLPVGTYTYFCTIHDPVMQGTIQVVPDDVPLDNPAPQDFTEEIAGLTAEADALVAELSAPAPQDVDGQRVWTVAAGARTRERGGVGIVSFLPAALPVRAGDAVRWVPGDEAHGVTFPDNDTPAAWYFSFGCELDEPHGGAPGVPAAGFAGFFGLPSCPGGRVEMTATPHATNPVRAPGDAVLSPTTLHNSGVLAPAGAPDRIRGRAAGSGRHWPSEFRATFPLDGLVLPYRCQVHGALMAGSVTVAG